MKKALTIALAASMAASGIQARESKAKDDVILHAWSWHLDTIAANMHAIADAGYTMVQTSPVNTCYVGEDGGLALFSNEGDEITGKWYYYYQPIDWQIGNHMLGSRDSFKALGDSALKYNVRLVVDVLPNHTAFDTTAVTPRFNKAVGGHEHLYHANGTQPVRDYNDRIQCTLWAAGGLPDVNTENSDFQYYYLQYVNDLINLGARGFRYDTAKHIGLPDDPVDEYATENDFWDVATGRKAVKGLSLLMPDSLFIYGEVLQDRNSRDAGYDEYMDLVASNYGHKLRQVIEKGNARAADLNQWHHAAIGDHLVTWVESHDTYANAHESAHLSDDQIRTGWVFLTARAHGTPLFFSRPAGRTPDNYWGNNRVGPRGNDEFFHPEVVAVNKFRAAMAGQPENVVYSNDNAIVGVNRGSKGLALINFADKAANVDMATDLPDGTYTDATNGATFTIKKGVIKGKLPANGTAILQK